MAVDERTLLYFSNRRDQSFMESIAKETHGYSPVYASPLSSANELEDLLIRVNGVVLVGPQVSIEDQGAFKSRKDYELFLERAHTKKLRIAAILKRGTPDHKIDSRINRVIELEKLPDDIGRMLAHFFDCV